MKPSGKSSSLVMNLTGTVLFMVWPDGALAVLKSAGTLNGMSVRM